MTRKIISVLLAAAMLCVIACGCAAVGDIASNVADAAARELENQLKGTLEKHKVEVVELKSAFGQLNGEHEKALQFFCAALIKCESVTAAENCAKALDVVFEKAGSMTQMGSRVESEYLVHKTVNYDHADFTGGNYYTVYVYNSSLTGDLLKSDQ